MRGREAICAFLLIMVAGCGAREQWLVFLFTDARVPQFGDRVLVEILDDSNQLACTSCQHTFDGGEPNRWPLSFGIAPELARPASALHIRAQLFRSDHVDVNALDDLILGGAFLDALARLPDTAATVRMALRMDCFSVAPNRTPGSFQSCDPASGKLAPEVVLSESLSDEGLLVPGNWALGKDRACEGDLPDGMVCIRGGSFMLGGVHYPGSPSEPNTEAASPERLVLLSPYALDKEEFTVADFARLRAQQANVPAPLLRGQGGDKYRLCHATGGPSDLENKLPLNCVTYAQAGELCVRLGKRLPTEAEWEFAASNRWRETTYPWGTNENICEHTLISRSSTPFDLGAPPIFSAIDCRLRADGQLVPWGPSPSGHPLDVTDQGVRNLAGNLSEWCADMFKAYSTTCPGRNPQKTWLVDPLCKPPSASIAVVRGGSWLTPSSRAGAILRDGMLPEEITRSSPIVEAFGIGFRCAKTMLAK